MMLYFSSHKIYNDDTYYFTELLIDCFKLEIKYFLIVLKFN